MSAASLPRDRGPRVRPPFRRPHLFERLARRLARRAFPHRRAAAQPRTIHLRRCGRGAPSADARADRGCAGDAGDRPAVPDRADGRRGGSHPPHVRDSVRAGGDRGRCRHARLRAFRRDDSHDLGTDRKSRAPVRRRAPPGADGALALRHESRRPHCRGAPSATAACRVAKGRLVAKPSMHFRRRAHVGPRDCRILMR